ncbi:IS21-like element helper ATPase IstB [Ureibacillus chungkukjangi]|uniref:DNA replication protein DnaC n=1 Tax=Ureibacillus chungkukjangi TaxID=1202712 RepID=A0A318TCJ1_9BACL|nr:IS21-like element helper ATPase IstB [Ureibacillus chungkukjangi]EFX6585684.1 AAA family ATPase [Shigella dysenteriae]MCM3390718.1 IS21-like element helper ATPase IstB [Ureibacillus chungkukjangi]PYF01517.1 DNA replication protein DnaC [Ureibacillus chungkukjangi]HCG4536276.1 IS21-like element helper ATPase IstB [Salmonella enterica subsp. enterica serovar Typhi str. AG3]
MNLKEMCKTLRLAHVSDIYSDIPCDDPTQFLEALFQKELQLREEAKAERLVKKARFLQKKSLSSFQWSEHIHFPTHIDYKELCTINFIARKENLILTGAPGTGKTHLATGIGYEACKQGLEVRFYRVSDLADVLERAWSEGKLSQLRNRFKSVDLIILDEMGYVPFNKEGAELLFQLISDWYEQKSLIITSNLEFSQWNRVFSDSRLTAALVDRVIHHAHILNFTGDSFRVTNALSRQK